MAHEVVYHGAMRAFSNRPLRRFGKPVRLERAGADLRDADGYPVDGATVEMDAVADIQPVRDMAEWNLPDGARPNDVRKLLINLPVKARDEASEADEVVEGTGTRWRVIEAKPWVENYGVALVERVTQ